MRKCKLCIQGMCVICNESLSPFEILGRNVVYPFSFNRTEEIKPGLFYPKMKEDSERSGYFTDKLSMVRLCRCLTDSLDVNIEKHVAVAKSFLRPDKRGCMPEFRGWKIDSVKNFIRTGIFSFESAPSEKNPYHCHLILKGYVHSFDSSKSSVSQLLTQSQKMILDRLQRDTYYLELTKKVNVCEVCCVASPRC